MYPDKNDNENLNINPNEEHNSQESLNNENKQENKHESDFEKYRQIELTPQQQQKYNQNTDLPSQSQVPNQGQTQIDPVQQVKNLISSGYTPSLDLIQSSSELLQNGNTDYSDVWFAVLLQKLIRELKTEI